VDIVRKIREAIAANPFMAGEGHSAPAQTVDVIVPIYNAREELAACVTSVARQTLCPFRLVLINDGSTDPQVSRFLAGLRGASPRLIVVDRPENRGFVSTVNEGLAMSAAGDVVILNSDTVVSRQWLQKMTAVARSRPDVATVTPLTNNGTICSVPDVLEDNAIPDGYDVESFADLVETTSLEIFPEAPTGVGFCMLITRQALHAVGRFDAGTFGRGYGEENDFCQRAIQAGFVNLIADNTFVYHKGRASFGDRSGDLLARSLAEIDRKHPGYRTQVARFYQNHPLAPFHALLRENIAVHRSRRETIGIRVLHILHHGGGTEKHARDLAALDDRTVLSYVLISDGRNLDVDEYYAGRRLRSLRFPLPVVIGPYGPLRDAAYRDALTTICWTLDVDLIHVHHLMHNTLDIADVAAERGIRYVMTLHDYHTLCPMYTLLDPEGLPCGACTVGEGRSVEACMKRAGQPASYLPEYQAVMSGFLHGAARLFVPNTRVLEIIGPRFPELVQAVSVVEHGHRRAAEAEADEHQLRRGPAPPLVHDGRASLNVAVIGGLEVHKGSAVFRDLLRANRRDETTFHLYGTTPDPDITRGERNQVRRLEGSKFIYHGAYEGRDIVRMLIADGIHVGLQLAIWPETFSYTLSEFVDAGVPVIAGSLGAQGERIDRCRLGWTVPDIRDPGATLAILDQISRDPVFLRDVASGMRRDEALVPLDTVWREYAANYRELVSSGSASMQPNSERAAPTFSKGYVASLAMALSESMAREQRTSQRLSEVEAELESMRSRLRSPRHRIAEALGNAIQKVPVVWPAVARTTEAILRWERRRGQRGRR
jgi:GT2 family glycosyltransferase/glycosyltransferase involved in cell wall biosynthesis